MMPPVLIMDIFVSQPCKLLLASGINEWYLPHMCISRTDLHDTWWRHQKETFSVILALMRGIHRSPVDSPHNGQWRRALVFSLICTLTKGSANNREADHLKRHHAHHDVTAMRCIIFPVRYTIRHGGTGLSGYHFIKSDLAFKAS